MVRTSRFDFSETRINNIKWALGYFANCVLHNKEEFRLRLRKAERSLEMIFSPILTHSGRH